MGDTLLPVISVRDGFHLGAVPMHGSAASGDEGDLGQRSNLNVVPRTDKLYCYTCGDVTLVERTRGDQDRLRLRYQDTARSRFYTVNDVDIEPVICVKPSCRSTFERLPALELLEYSIPYRESTVSGDVAFSDIPQRHDPRLVNNEEVFNYVNATRREAVEVLIQDWLFFGFLHECLGDSYHRRHYLRKDETGATFLSLKHLTTVIPSWMNSAPVSGDLAENLRLSVVNVLDTSRNILLHLKFHDLHAQLREFLAYMADIFTYALNLLYPERPMQEGFLLCGAPLMVESLTALGWCRHEAQNALTTITTLSMKALYQQIDRRGRESDHKDCSLQECISSKKVYNTTDGLTHRVDCSRSRCKFVPLEDAPMKKACSILEANNYPLVRASFDSTASIKLEVVPYAEGLPYVAISHVWAQGLGNKKDNGLHACQLEYLIRCMSELWSRTFSQDGHPLLFWLDTLCCPVSSRAKPEVRKIAINLMRHTYERASHVLVIDSELEGVNVLDYSPIELGCRISTSSWAGRLWTMHEGQIPYHLWFQFQGGAVDSHSLWLALRAIRCGSDLTARVLASNVLLMFQGLRLLCGRYDTLGNIRKELAIITRGMQNRTTSWESDEAICISNIFGLKTARVQEFDAHEERMRNIWQQLSKRELIPRSTAFSVGPRLQLTGYKWAHSTFLSNKAALGFQDFSSLNGHATDQGLEITGSGMIFACAIPVAGFDMRQIEAARPREDIFVLKTTSNRYERFVAMDAILENLLHVPIVQRNNLWDDLQRPVGTLALLRKHLTSESPSRDDGMCLLVQIIRREGKNIFCKRLRLGSLRALPKDEEASIALAVYQADRLRNHDLCKRFRQLEDLPNDEQTRSRWLEMQKEVEPLFAFDDSLRGVDEIPEEIRQTGPDGLFEVRVAVALAGRYAVASEALSEQTQWCLD